MTVYRDLGSSLIYLSVSVLTQELIAIYKCSPGVVLRVLLFKLICSRAVCTEQMHSLTVSVRDISSIIKS